MTTTSAIETTVTVGEARQRLPEILELARRDRHHILIVQAGRPQGVVLGPDEYRRLQDLDRREQRRRRVLANPPPAAASLLEWQAAFETLARVRDQATPLSDEELDALVAEAQAAVRTPLPHHA